MTPAAPPASSPSRFATIAAIAAIAAAVAAVFAIAWGSTELATLRRATEANTATLTQVLGEVTRMRIEQSAGSKGPQALLEKLRVYAPLLTSARTTDPDYQNAKKEMDAILRAFATLGKDAWPPIQDRLAQLKPDKDFDEVKNLLDASVAVDPVAGTQLLKEVLLGHRLPSPRVRWYAADKLNQTDRPVAQALLRQVLRTESSRGFNPDYASAYPGATIPDQAAMSSNGFANFVLKYVDSKDPQMEDTLLMVVGRSEHDRSTVQECIKALGLLRSAKAVPVIEKLYKNPPQQQQDPIFLGYCLEALVDIQGAEAKGFLERELASPSSETVAKKLQFLLNRINNGQPPRDPVTPPANAGKEKGK
jgi:hypothetical protein